MTRADGRGHGRRMAYGHEADLEMAIDADERGPGGSITLALCGSLDHPPPCPLAPHHTDVRRDASVVSVRTLFAAMPDDELAVRRAIAAALASGSTVAPDGTTVRWVLLGERPVTLHPGEADHAGRLIASAEGDRSSD